MDSLRPASVPERNGTKSSSTFQSSSQPASPGWGRKDPHDLADAAFGGSYSGGRNPLLANLYSTSTSLSKSSVLNTVKRPREGEEKQTKSKRPDYMTPPPPRRMLDEQSLRALLDARSPLCAPPRREGWATPPFAQPALPAIGPGPAPPPPGAPAEGDRGAVGWRGPAVTSASAAMDTDRDAEEEVAVAKQSPFAFIEKVRSRVGTSDDNVEGKEFVYLNIIVPNPKALFNPYNVRIVPHHKINHADYFTMSAKGVTHIVSGEADFTPLRQWEREHRIFHAIFEIPFFRKYRRWKAFYFWHKYIRRTTINQYKEFLEDNLFVLNKDLCPNLIKARKLCLDIRSIAMYKAEHDTETLDRYCYLQQAQRDRAWKELSKISSNITMLVSDACKASMKTHLEADLRDVPKPDVLDDADLMVQDPSLGMSSPGKGPRGPKKAAQLHTAMMLSNGGAPEQPYRQTYTELSQKRAQCRRLTNYIRLVDYMVIDSIVALCMKSMHEVRTVMLYPKPKVLALPEVEEAAKVKGKADLAKGKGSVAKKPEKPEKQDRRASAAAGHESDGDDEGRAKPIFTAEVVFQEDLLMIVPNREAFDGRTEEVLQGFIATITRLERFLQMEEFRTYTELIVADHGDDADFGVGPDVAAMVTQQEEYRQLETSIRESLGTAFRHVEQYQAEYEGFKKMFIENRKMDPVQIKADDPPLDWFREQMDKYKQQHVDLSRLRVQKHVGLFMVLTKGLKEFFLPAPVKCLKEIHTLLPIIAREKNGALLRELSHAVNKLGKTPETVEQFVDHLQFHQRVTERMEYLEQEFENVRELYQLLYMENIGVHQDDEVAYSAGTVPNIQALRIAIGVAEDSKEIQIRQFSADIDRRYQALTAQLKGITQRASHPMLSDESSDMQTVIDYITAIQEEVQGLQDLAKKYADFQELFQVEVTKVDEIYDISQDVGNKVKLWTGLRDWLLLTTAWNNTVFGSINPEEVTQEVNKYSKLVAQVSRSMPDNPVVLKLKAMVEEFKLTLPVISCLRNPALQKHHFALIDEIVGRELSKDPDFTLGVLIDLKVMDLKDDIQTVSNTATQEAALEELVLKVQKIWVGGGADTRPVEFNINPYKDYKDVYVLGAVDEIMTQLEDSGVIISTVVSSRFCTGGLKVRVEKWEEDIKYMNDTLDKWLEFQRNWMYLESIFGSAEIARQWPQDAKTFSAVDKQWKDLMKRAFENPSVYRIMISNLNVQEKFETNNKQLERILNNLEKKLEEKRRYFPRFYFLSNDDLLDILSQIKNPMAIQPHLLKMFDNIKKLEFGPNNTDVVAMVSAEGETVPLAKYPKARGEVEKWLSVLEQYMVMTLRRLANVAVKDYEGKQRTDWIFEHPCQLVLTVSQVFWCKEVAASLESADGRQGLVDYQQVCYRNLSDLAVLTGRDLNRIQRGLLSTLITTDVHSRDLVDQMVEEGVARPTEFGWMKQLRTYWDVGGPEGGEVVLRQNNSAFTYGYEYQGCQPRLVITPLTDRIYMTVTGALRLCLGAAPSGPAGTGKTETVKDMAKCLAFQCIVYNCSDGVTYKMMEKFFSGLAQTGAWACLDEFNRINIEVLSVIASQLAEVRTALLAKAEKFTFQGVPDVDLKPNFGVFITMNPGYAGRTELPDNLKVLFRPVAVMTPDFRMIAEVILFSEGFKDAKSLSLKITQLFKLSSEQLSPQDHYDFGMRALKSILVMAGGLKRNSGGLPEEFTLIRACRDSNIPKFVADDIPLFKGILADLFPGLDLPAHDYGELQRAINKQIEDRHLQHVDTFNTKITQLYETLVVRHGVMLVGPTGSGKTVNRDVIRGSLTYLRQQGTTNQFCQSVQQYSMNPKSITYGELYGEINPFTGEWKDGVCAIIAKNAVADTTPDMKWILFDGPVDTLWIESMNSVLDDSKLLCLDNGVRIKLPDTVRMMFEVMDLSVASPATTSRCGMVYMNPAELGWLPAVETWLALHMSGLLTSGGLEFLQSLFHTYVQKGLNFIAKECSMLVQTVDINLTASLCELLQALVINQKINLKEGPEEQLHETLKLLFGFCFIWSIGGNVDQKSQEKFDSFARDSLESVLLFPPFGMVYDFQMDLTTRKLLPWQATVPDFKYNPKVPFFQILVPTVDTVRYSYLVKNLVAARKPVLLNGLSGTGKSVVMWETLYGATEELSLQLIGIQFSAQTSSARTQEMIEAKLKVKRKNLLGAMPGKKVVLFIDDLNMPTVEQFGAQPPIELLRQMLGMGGFYDRKLLFWKDVQDVVLVSACGPPEGGRSPTTPRMLRFFHLLSIAEMAEDTLRKIFASILQGFLEPFSADVRGLVKPMTYSSVEMYLRIKEDLRPRPSKAHYTFNLRDLSKVFQGIMQVVPRTCSSLQSTIHLWIHENMRCFHDRLVDDVDRRYFTEELMMDVLRRNFAVSESHEELFEGTPILFGDFLRIGTPLEQRVYEEVTDPSRLSRLFDEYLDEYNLNSSKPMSLVFFEDHCAHLTRIIRILRQPRGNALLVGLGGSGKQSLTRLAAGIQECRCFQIEVVKNYDIQAFRADLGVLYNTAGVEGIPIVFLFADNQIVSESFLEDINNILNTGEVPNLFSPEDKEKVINACTEAARAAGGGETRDAVYSFFINRVRDNLHIVLCMSPVGDNFRRWCRQFPSLVNCCAIDWFDKWPREALLAVARRLMQDVDFGSTVHDGFLHAVTECCVDIHVIVGQMSERFYEELRRYFFVTPTSYLEFISLYISLLEEKRTETTTAINRIKNGKVKMKETNASVDVMQEELKKMQPLLQEARVKTEAMMADLAVRKGKASEIQRDVSAVATEAGEQQAVAAALQADAQKDLDEAMPELEGALKSLDSLNKNDIGEIRGYTNAPKAVEKTMAAVLTILKEPKQDWDHAKSVLGDPNFLRRLRDYDKDNIPAVIIQKLQKFMTDPDFTPEKVGSGGSAACKSLCMWVRAMDLYYRVSRAVAPKKAALAQAQSQLDETNEKLNAAQAKLQAVEMELNDLQAMFDKSNKEKEDLEYNIDLSSKRLVAASALTGSLAQEVVRWDALIEQMEKDVQTLAGDVFLSSACIAYLGAFTAPFRLDMIKQWCALSEERGIVISGGFSLVGTLANQMQMREWAIMTLPTDNTSLENAVMVTVSTSTKSRRWPLMIDPQGQAAKWISRMEAKFGLKTIKLSEPGYIRTMEQAIRNGTPVLVEDVGETLDPALEPVLLKQVYTANGRTLINFGGTGSAIDYDPMFRFYLTTKIANPRYLPDICIKVSLINFTVTMQGLEEQMLGDVVAIEKASLEETKNKIIQSVASDKKRLKQYEDGILEDLESATGNILDNQKVIDSLKKAQTTSELLSKRLAEAEQQSQSINEARLEFTPVATRASILYFVMADLALIDPMYQYSLDYFKKLFGQVVQQCPPHDDFQEHLDVLIQRLTEAVYVNVCRGLFKKDKAIFSLLIAVQILRQRKEIPEGEWQFLLRAGGMTSAEDENHCPLDWMDPKKWALLCALERVVHAFHGLCADIKERPHSWRRWVEQSDYQGDVPVPGPDEVAGPEDDLLAAVEDEAWQTANLKLQCATRPKRGEFAATLTEMQAAGKYTAAAAVGETLFQKSAGSSWLRLTPFQRILLIKCCRPPHVVFAITDFVKHSLGPRFIDPPPFDLYGSTVDANALTPIIFILSPGADPFALLLKFAEEKQFGERLHIVSLGQGQGDNAKRLIDHGKRTGDWVILQNCHLSKSFMPELEKQISSFSSNLTHINPTFRLWLTSMPSEFFPIPVLQNSIKLTNENPTGLRANMIRCYKEIKDVNVFTQGEQFPECSKENAYHKLLYGLCFFHSIIQERKKFGPLGWNTKYEFNDTDLNVGMQWLQMFLQENTEIPWEALRYVIGQIVYGGRVTDPWDRRTLLSILHNFLRRELLEDGYSLSPSGTYSMPCIQDIEGYRGYTATQLPHHDGPEIFGMHENANIAFQLQDCEALLGTVVSIQPRATKADDGGLSPEEMVAQKAAELLESCPAVMLMEEAGPSTFRVMPNGLPYSISTVLSHELLKFNILLKQMRDTLLEFQKALKGLTVMSEQLEGMFMAFLNNSVPSLWEGKAYPSLKPLGSWMKDLIQRVDFIRKWLRKGEPPVFWMSGMFYPHGFMTGTLQAFARQFGTSVDVLGFAFSVLDTPLEDIKKSPPAGVYIHGLFMDSCRWNGERRVIGDSAGGEQFTPLPVIHFLPEQYHKKPDGFYSAPLYKTIERRGNISSLGQSTNFILAVELPSDKPEDYWVQKGAALVCALND